MDPPPPTVVVYYAIADGMALLHSRDWVDWVLSQSSSGNIAYPQAPTLGVVRADLERKTMCNVFLSCREGTGFEVLSTDMNRKVEGNLYVMAMGLSGADDGRSSAGSAGMDWTPGDVNSQGAMTKAAEEGFRQCNAAPWVSMYIKKELDRYCNYWNPNLLYTPVCSVFQSSGWGKSRNLCLLSELGVFVVYVSFQKGPGFPRRSPIADKLLSPLDCPPTFPLDHYYELKFTILIKACLEKLSDFSGTHTDWLDMQLDDDRNKSFWMSISSAMDGQQRECIRKVCERTEAGTPFLDAVEVNRKSFSDDCRLLRGRPRDSGLNVLFIFDEARCLVEPVGTSNLKPFIHLRRAFRGVPMGSGIFSVVTDTSSPLHYFQPRLHYFQPPKTSDPSARALRAPDDSEDSYAPIYLMGTLDIGVPPLGAEGLTVDIVENPKRFLKYGRPLWGVSCKLVDLVHLACSKLLGGGDRYEELLKVQIKTRPKVEITKTEALALLSTMLALDITPQISIASDLVGSYLRTCCYISGCRSFMHTTTVVEPVLSEAAARIQHELLKNDEFLLTSLIDMCKRGVVENGCRGELVSRIVLLRAAHKASREKLPKEPVELHVKYSRMVNLNDFWRKLTGGTVEEQILRCPGALDPEIQQKLEVLGELEPETCHIFFNAFTPVLRVPTKADLVKCFMRCVAIVCKRNQHGVDLMIPFVKGKVVSEETMSMIIIQVKNGVDPNSLLNATAKLSPQYGKFQGFEVTIPYIALYMGFDSSEDKAEIPLKRYDTRSGHDPLAKQIPIAMFGLSSQLYPCLESDCDTIANRLRELRVSWADTRDFFEGENRDQYLRMFEMAGSN